MYEFILKISLCHFLGDFVLQSDKMVREIRSKGFRSYYFYGHILIHFLLLFIATGFESKYLLAIFLLSLSHLAIDGLTKILWRDKFKDIYGLFIDQALHFLAIALFIYSLFDYTILWNNIFNAQNYLLLLTLILLTQVSSILIKKMMSIFDYPIPNSGLKEAGMYIGVLERLFIFSFILLSFWEGIGFLLAAKSIFRFGELKEGKDVKLTEYILIGTLMSFGIAMLISVAYMSTRKILV